MTAETRRQPPELVQAARDQRGARVTAKAEPVGEADGDRHHVLERAPDGDAGGVVRGVDPEALSGKAGLHLRGRRHLA